MTRSCEWCGQDIVPGVEYVTAPVGSAHIGCDQLAVMVELDADPAAVALSETRSLVCHIVENMTTVQALAALEGVNERHKRDALLWHELRRSK